MGTKSLKVRLFLPAAPPSTPVNVPQTVLHQSPFFVITTAPATAALPPRPCNGPGDGFC